MSQKKVAVITGVSSGIGRATATLLSARGFRVFGTMRRPTEANGHLRGVELLRLDVRDEDSVRSSLGVVLEQAGRVDALVNNAGYTLIGSLEETGLEEAREVFETNFFGVLRMTQAVLPVMREQGYGRIANIGSVVGFLPAPYQGIYAASKHALEGYSESLDHEVRKFGIRVSVIEPGYTRQVVNPDTVRAQMESAVIFGLTATLYGEITLERGRVQQRNFHDYRMLRMHEAPQIEVHIVPSNEKHGGVGEPGVPPVAAAVGNAIFAASGKRIRRLPIRTQDLA